MNITNPFPYISFPFVYLWIVLRENNTKRGRIATSILSLLLIIGGLCLLFSWYKVPTKKHFISTERIYTKKASDNCYFYADYYLQPSTGGFYEDPFKYKESVYFFWDDSKKGKTYPRILGNKTISKVSDVIAGDLGKMLQEECDKKSVSFEYFDYGFLLTHMYEDFTYEMGKDYSSIFSSDTLINENHISSVMLQKTQTDVKGLEILHKKYYSNRIMSGFDFNEYSRQYNGLLFTNKLIYPQPIRREMSSFYGFEILNKLYKFFSLHDITKANYSLTLFQDGIDSVNYTIRFKEGVVFSESNIPPTKKGMNSISFEVTNDKRFSNFNINFYVEFLESNNIQTIRTGLLMALLALPFSMLAKNIWALLTKTPPPSIPTNPAKENTELFTIRKKEEDTSE